MKIALTLLDEFGYNLFYVEISFLTILYSVGCNSVTDKCREYKKNRWLFLALGDYVAHTHPHPQTHPPRCDLKRESGSNLK